MTKSKPTLPPRKWYSLQQAADKLTRKFNEPVTIEDLIHYWIHGYLMFSVKMEYNVLSLNIGNNRFLQTKENDLPQIILANEIRTISEKDFELENIFFAQTFKQAKENEFRLWAERKSFKFIGDKINDVRRLLECLPVKEDDILRMNGFFNFPFHHHPRKIKTEETILNNGLNLDLGINYLLTPKNNEQNRLLFILYLKENQNIHFKINDFYILHSDFDDFINGKKYTDEIKGKIEEIEKEKTSPRKQANQAEFIKALLKLHYGIDEPEKARSLLNGQLAKKFASAGIEINITPETLRNWLNTAK
ncbi:hypothetical protein BKG94_02070 [Rodentibacter ratti]|uniref:hypothetical protein n=1 Tax=Rodentibacter ratti TaxID=1906745 RepID=UPI000985E740|nr:hypothetical protein [Rodentibacter ratti]OOF89403.1 hypothetical protein BKG94_02070 [Rodentibacter ratti]